MGAEDGMHIQDVNVYFAQGSLCSGTLMNPRYPHGHLTESRVLRLIVYWPNLHRFANAYSNFDLNRLIPDRYYLFITHQKAKEADN